MSKISKFNYFLIFNFYQIICNQKLLTYQSYASLWSWCSWPALPHTHSGHHGRSGSLHSPSRSFSSSVLWQSPPQSEALQWWSFPSWPGQRNMNTGYLGTILYMICRCLNFIYYWTFHWLIKNGDIVAYWLL